MKKLIVAFVAMAVAVVANAATVSWAAGSSVKGPTGTTIAKGGFDMFVWIVDAGTYNATSIDSIYKGYADLTSSATKGVWGTTAIKGVTATTTAGDDVDVFGIILMTYTDADGKDWYIANKATTHTDGLGGGANVLNLAKNIGGGSGSAISGWTAVAAVPEPTSGLLLLLGMAGLALRRKQA